jgi:uncharacterized protein (TIGR04255 family)
MPVTKAELDEIFPRPLIREVACEIRFAPRLRVNPEVWRIQDKLADDYPQLDQESVALAEGRLLQSYVFTNTTTNRIVKLSQENFAIIFNSYSSFEAFKEEALRRIRDFSELFEIQSFLRVGLRYVNHLDLPAENGIAKLQTLVNAPVDYDRFEASRIEQFLTEFRLRAKYHRLTVRGFLLQVPGDPPMLKYLLDLDCYTTSPARPDNLSGLLDEFHTEIQAQFLEHIREECKQEMRKPR